MQTVELKFHPVSSVNIEVGLSRSYSAIAVKPDISDSAGRGFAVKKVICR